VGVGVATASRDEVGGPLFFTQLFVWGL
jgi:hypothetical protein